MMSAAEHVACASMAATLIDPGFPTQTGRLVGEESTRIPVLSSITRIAPCVS